MPKVLIVCPTFNHANLITGTLDSIMRQTYTDFHLTIVNDGSTDETADVLLDYITEHVKLDKSQRRSISVMTMDRNRGASAALNYGFASSTVMGAKYETWISSDNLYRTHFLEKLVEVLDHEHHIGFVYSDFVLIDENEGLIGTIIRKEYSKHTLETVYEPGMCFMWRKGLRERAGLWFDERLQCQDYNMTLRMSEFAKFKHIPDILGEYRVHKAQIGTKGIGKHSLEAKRLYFLWKNGEKEGIPQTFLKELNKADTEAI